MKDVIMTLIPVLALATRVPGAPDEGLVAHYSFEEGKGTVARDRSGNGNDGRIVGEAQWVRGPYGTALSLDGRDDYVDCGKDEGLNIAARGTVAIWCRPTSLRGGLVNWSTGSGWTDERLVLAINTYRRSPRLIACFADGKGYRPFQGYGMLGPNEWVHLAFAFDGRTISICRDGLLNTAISQPVKPNIRGVPLWIGRCLGLGKQYFHGLVDDVRVYNRPLAPEEILAIYKRTAEARGKDVSVFRVPRLDVQAYQVSAKLLVEADVRAMRPLPAGARVRTALCKPGGGKPIAEQDITDLDRSIKAETIVDIQRLPAGEYVVRASVREPGDAVIGEESRATFTWNGQSEEFRNAKILNNLVWELLNVRDVQGKRDFVNPRDRWVFMRTTARVAQGGKVWASIDSDSRGDAAIVHDDDGGSTLEAMRFLAAGKHTVHVDTAGDAELQHLIVRAIPALQHAFYHANPHIHPYGPYDWEFLKRDVLPNVNVMISGGGAEPPHLKEWKKMGRSWITIVGLPRPLTADEAGVEKAYAHWSKSPGLQNPLMDGIIIDEFGGGDDPVYDVYREAVERIYENPKFAGKAFMPYGGTFHGDDRSREFAKVAIDGGGYVCWERYLPEQPTERQAWDFIRASVVDEMSRWEKGLPGVTEKMVVVYGYMSQPTESLNIDPAANFKVYMDMQIRTLATHPAFFGLGGIQEYHSAYSDEENVRWAGRLYRHYCIEGNTEPLTRHPYKLSHIKNPDFEDGAAGWAIESAEEGSMKAAKYSGYSWLEGRYPRTTIGETFLLMKRSARRPNAFAQTIRDLEPGRLYSLKMITGDYDDLVQEQSSKTLHAVSIRLDNVDIVPGPKTSFQFAFPNCYAHRLGKFDRKHNYWMNYHWRVFRAKGTTAKLTVSDWKSENEPGGPIGQQLMLNFVEIQPYIGE